MDAEWFQVETPGGAALAAPHADPAFPNKEAAAAFAREKIADRQDTLTVVKYTRREVRTFQRKVTIEEADVPTA